MDVHLRDLRYFVAVAEELSFTRAATRLYVSQPVLSKQIRQLERNLRATLLRRDSRGVTLSPAGLALLPHAQRLLKEWSGPRTKPWRPTPRTTACCVSGCRPASGGTCTRRPHGASPSWQRAGDCPRNCTAGPIPAPACWTTPVTWPSCGCPRRPSSTIRCSWSSHAGSHF